MKRWDENTVQSYLSWFETPEGAFAFTQQRRAVDRLLTAWPRPGRKLLDVGCGPGVFLKAFWEGGFDICGLDSSPEMVDAARERLGPHACYHVGNAECLPFEDDEFDYVTLMTLLEFCDDPALALKEAARVARYGILISFLNRNSVYYLQRGKTWPWHVPQGTLGNMKWYTPREMRRLVTACIGRGYFSGASVLPGPQGSWKDCFPWGQINRTIYPQGVGCYGILRVDFTAQKPLTPLYAFKARPAAG